MHGELQQAVGDGAVEVGSGLAQRVEQCAGSRSVAPRLTVPRDHPALGEQSHLAEHDGALHDAGSGDLLQRHELGLVLHRPVEADEHPTLVVVVVDEERRTPVGEGAGHLVRQPVEGHEVGDAVSDRDARARRHRERTVERAAPLEHRDPPGVVELVEQHVAHAVVLVQLDAFFGELLGKPAS